MTRSTPLPSPSSSANSDAALYQTLLDECHSVESSLNLFHLSSSVRKLHSHLQDLRPAAFSPTSSTATTETKIESGMEDTNIKVYERYSECASSLLRLHVVRTIPSAPSATATTEREILETIDRCLDLCGRGTTFETAVGLLRSIASEGRSGGNGGGDTGAIAAVLRTVRRLLFAASDDGLLLREYVAYDPRCGGTDGHGVVRRRRIRSFVDETLRLPVLVAAACHAARVHLPRWAVRSRYFTGTVAQSAASAMSCARGAIEVEGETETEEMTYFLFLVKRMVHHGGTDDVALGFHRFYSTKNTSGHGDDNGDSGTSLETLRRVICHVASSSSPRECAALIRSVLRHAVAELARKGGGIGKIVGMGLSTKEMEVSDTSVPGAGFVGKGIVWYTIEICRDVLQSFEMMRDELVRSTVLSPCPLWGMNNGEDSDYGDFSGGGDGSGDMVVANDGSRDEREKKQVQGKGEEVEQRVLTQFIVLLLASCGNIGFDDDDDDDNSGSVEGKIDDDNGNGTYRSRNLEITTSNQGSKDHSNRKESPTLPSPPLATPSSYVSFYATLIRHLQETSLLWSEPTFIHRTDPPRQRQVTRFLIDALPYLSPSALSRTVGSHRVDKSKEKGGSADDDEDARRQQSTVGHLIAGVTNRLRITGDAVRVDGMVVAERLAPLLGKQELKFEELDERRKKGGAGWEGLEGRSKSVGDGKVLGSEEIDANVGCKEVNDGTLEVEAIEENINGQKNRSLNMKKKKKKKIVVDIDPDEEYVSASDDDDWNSDSDGDRSSCYSSDSEWDEDDLLPYDPPDSDDEEDLLLVPKPTYLRDCLDLLRAEGDDHETLVRHKTGLIALPTLVRVLPPDLPDLSAVLARQLLNMENKFDVEGFEGYVWDSMCALVVCDAGEIGLNAGGGGVVGCLVGELFNGGYSLGTRLDILDAMRYGSSELCGTVELELQSATQSRLNETSKEQNRITVTGKRGIVPIETIKGASTNLSRTGLDLKHAAQNAAGNLGKTRRWGRNRHSTATSPTVTNRFGPLAPLFFYPLVQGFAATKTDLALWGGDNGGRLLSRLLITLSCFVYDAGSYPGTTEVLAADLFELAWSFYGAENPEVRLAVLVAVATAVPFLGRDHVLPSECVVETLHATKVNDCDGECRRLASAILDSFVAERDVW